MERKHSCVKCVYSWPMPQANMSSYLLLRTLLYLVKPLKDGKKRLIESNLTELHTVDMVTQYNCMF